MNVVVLTQFLVPFLPFLMQIGNKAIEGTANKFGEDAWQKAKAVWNKLRPKVEAKQDIKVAAEQVAAKPESEARQAVLQEELETLFTENPDLMAAIAKIMQEDTPDGIPGTQIVQNVIGSKNQVIGQVYGGNVFGNIKGNVTR